MSRLFIRDENNKIVGTKLYLEKLMKEKEIEKLKYEYINIKNKIQYFEKILDIVLNSTSYGFNKGYEVRDIQKKIMLLNRDKQQIICDILEHKKALTYNFFEETNLNVENNYNELQFNPIISEKQKEKQKIKNKNLKEAREYTKQSKSKFITLERL